MADFPPRNASCQRETHGQYQVRPQSHAQDRAPDDVNKARRSLLRSSVRKVEEAIASGDRNAALAAFKDAEPVIMRAAQRGVVHKNNASRKVSRLAHRIAKLAK